MCATSTVAYRQKGSAMNYQHFLITRFNVRMPWKSQHWGADPEWCASRLKMCSELALPSVANQTTADFTWMILVDRGRTPPFVKDALSAWRTRLRCGLLVETMDEFTPDGLSFILRQRACAEVSRIATTRLDTDDGLAPGFIGILQNFLSKQSEFTGLINIDGGWCYRGGKYYVYRDRANMFFTCVSMNAEGLTTSHHYNHSKIGADPRLVNLPLSGMFILVNHAGNISARGNVGTWRVSRARVRQQFGFEVPGREEGRVLVDNLAFAAKWPALQVLGRCPMLRRLLERMRNRGSTRATS